jgi:hypothetical protein
MVIKNYKALDLVRFSHGFPSNIHQTHVVSTLANKDREEEATGQ